MKKTIKSSKYDGHLTLQETYNFSTVAGEFNRERPPYKDERNSGKWRAFYSYAQKVL